MERVQRFHSNHAQHHHSSCILTLLLIRVATRAATTTMETTTLTVVETVVMLSVLLLFINARVMKSRIMSWEVGKDGRCEGSQPFEDKDQRPVKIYIAYLFKFGNKI
jgi:hypothetical protein